jgi:beta-lactamase class A
MLIRRGLLLASIAASSMLVIPATAKPAARRVDAAKRLQALEKGNARLGVCLLDTVTGEVSGNRIDERFAICPRLNLIGSH